MQPNQDVIKRWTGSAPYWEKHRNVIRQMFAPVTAALIEEARIAPRGTVLDIATGPGEPSLTVAALVGPEGKVCGIDPIAEMVAAARREADRLGLANTQFDVAFADQLPFPNETFDAVISRFGVMFFPSPADGIREMLRVLKPGKTIALAAWGFADRNPFFHVVQHVIDRFIDTPPPAPDAPDACRFADSGKLQRVLIDAGAHAPSERMLHFAIQAPISVEDFWTIRREMSERLREAIASLPPESFKELERQALQALREYATGDGISFPAEVLIVSGTRPA